MASSHSSRRASLWFTVLTVTLALAGPAYAGPTRQRAPGPPKPTVQSASKSYPAPRRLGPVAVTLPSPPTPSPPTPTPSPPKPTPTPTISTTTTTTSSSTKANTTVAAAVSKPSNTTVGKPLTPPLTATANATTVVNTSALPKPSNTTTINAPKTNTTTSSKPVTTASASGSQKPATTTNSTNTTTTSKPPTTATTNTTTTISKPPATTPVNTAAVNGNAGAPVKTANADPSVPPPFKSLLWGESGELWNPKGRLLDYSFVGYAAGERPLPALVNPPATRTAFGALDASGVRVVSVQGFGAVGDGITDDSDAIQKGLNSAPVGSVLWFPRGKYKVTKRIRGTRGVSLQGEGSGLTTLYFPYSMSEVDKKNVSGINPSPYSFGDYFITLVASGPPPTWSSTITTSAVRGDFTVQVANLTSVTPGSWIAITVSDPNNGALYRDLGMYVPGDTVCTSSLCQNRRDQYSFQSRVLEVRRDGSSGGLGGTLLLERPLPWNVSSTFTPRIFSWTLTPYNSEVGVSGFKFEFPWSAYDGHFKEAGYNALFLAYYSNCWARDLEFVNADLGLQLSGARFCTVSDVVLSTTKSRGGTDGHHGITFSSDTVDTLLTRFDIRSIFIHDITYDWFCRGNVVSDGKAVDLSMDHHKAHQFGMLWTNIDAGLGTRTWWAGGSDDRGPHAAALTTIWRVYTSGAAGGSQGKSAPIKPPPSDWAPMMNLVGSTIAPYIPPNTVAVATSWWVEQGIAPPVFNTKGVTMPKVHAVVEPANLHTSMVASRAARLKRWRPAMQ